MPPRPHDRRVHRALVAVVALALTYLVYVLAQGSGPGADTIVWAPGAGNGITHDDWPIVVLWLLGLALAGLLLRPSLGGFVRIGLLAGVGVVLTIAALTLLKGDGPDSGSTILAFSPAYGVNTGDLPVIGAWLVGVGTCVALWRRVRKPISQRIP